MSDMVVILPGREGQEKENNQQRKPGARARSQGSRCCHLGAPTWGAAEWAGHPAPPLLLGPPPAACRVRGRARVSGELTPLSG